MAKITITIDGDNVTINQSAAPTKMEKENKKFFIIIRKDKYDEASWVEFVTDDYIRADGCHPNEEGYTAIANAYYNAVNNYYNSSEKVGEIVLNAGNNWISALDIDNAEANAKYYVVEKSVPAGKVKRGKAEKTKENKRSWAGKSKNPKKV